MAFGVGFVLKGRDGPVGRLSVFVPEGLKFCSVSCSFSGVPVVGVSLVFHRHLDYNASRQLQRGGTEQQRIAVSRSDDVES